MPIRPDKHRCRWLFLTLALVLLGAQVLQSSHHHADHGVIADCLQCQVDSGQAAIIAENRTAIAVMPIRESHPDIAAAAVATFYRLAARGPPHAPV